MNFSRQDWQALCTAWLLVAVVFAYSIHQYKPNARSSLLKPNLAMNNLLGYNHHGACANYA
jgi:hypothetical protein